MDECIHSKYFYTYYNSYDYFIYIIIKKLSLHILIADDSDRKNFKWIETIVRLKFADIVEVSFIWWSSVISNLHQSMM